MSALLFLLLTGDRTSGHTNNGVDSEIGNYLTSDDSISVLWGVHDASASVGKVFKYRIPEDAFKGHVSKLEVSIFF